MVHRLPPPPPDQPLITVVGTRHPTRFGAMAAHTIAYEAAKQGIPTISGLAAGVDTTAHLACLQAGQPTWAVLGQGITTLPPGRRRQLADQIVACGGGLLSEVPPDTPCTPRLLVRRNRILAGLSEATVITQTGLPSPRTPAGTLHTARYAIEQGRLLAVAHPAGRYATEPESAGNLALTDPHGCDPAVLHATTPPLVAMIRTRRPVADLVLTGTDTLRQLWQALNRPTPHC